MQKEQSVDQVLPQVKVHLLIPKHDGNGVHLIKGIHTWRLPRVILSPRNFSIAWKHDCYLTDEKATGLVRFVHTILDPTSVVLGDEFFIRTSPPKEEPTGLRLLSWQEALERKLSVQTRLLLLLWMGAVTNAAAENLDSTDIIERFAQAALAKG